MAAYPTFACGQSSGSSKEIIDDLQVDRASNGAVRQRAFYSAPQYGFLVVHSTVTMAEISTMETFYATNRLLSFTFVWAIDGLTYTCRFAEPPVCNADKGPLGEITSKLLVTA